MKTRARLVLEKRFRQMANGKTLAAFSAAALLGLRLTAQSAEAIVINPNPCLTAYGGGSGPTVDVFVNDEFVETLFLSGLVDSKGKQYIDLTTGAGGGNFTSSDGGSFTIFAIPDGRPDPPRVFLDPGSGGASLLVATDMLVSADLLGTGNATTGATGKLSLVLDSNDSYGTCPGGKHTYGVNMDGLALGPTPTAKIEVTGEAVVRTFESSDVINLIPPDSTKPDVGPSLSAVTSPLAGGGFGGGVTESIDCGTTGNFDCPLQLRNTVTLTFKNEGDLLITSGSFGAAAAVEPGTGNDALVLGAIGVPFASFNAVVANQPTRNNFEVGALLKLGALSGGINPPGETFSLRIGDFAATLDPGSFVTRSFFGFKFYVFDGFVGGFPFKVVITPLFGQKVSVVAAGHGADLRPGTFILDLAIGDDKGTAAAKVFNLGR